MSKHCGLGNTQALIDAQWSGYVSKHAIASRLDVMCGWFLEKCHERPDETLPNCYRWLSLFFLDPQSFGPQYTDPGVPPPPSAAAAECSPTAPQPPRKR